MSSSKRKPEFKLIKPPERGSRIEAKQGELEVPLDPVIPIILGDGIGTDVSKAAINVIDAAVEKVYDGNREFVWFELPAGESSHRLYGEYLPKDTIDAIRFFIVSIKGPLITPIGGGFKSLNVTLRQELDLYACVRPVKWLRGVPSPIKTPEKLDLVIFRENTEDVYTGIEWEAGSADALKMIKILEEMGCHVRKDSGLGVKPISETASKRLIRAAIRYALENNRRSVTLMHKGNIMKYTEGAFRQWGYEVALSEFRDSVITEEEIGKGMEPERRLVIKDRIADSMFQQVLLRPSEYDVVATPNLNGDYLSDACAAQVGGLGIAPGANINYDSGVALFEPTHGAAPKYANQDKVNPSSMILSGAMMLDYIGLREASDLIKMALEQTVMNKTVTYDMHRQLEGAKLRRCSEFADDIIENMENV